MASQRPLDWVSLLIARFEEQVRGGLLTNIWQICVTHKIKSSRKSSITSIPICTHIFFLSPVSMLLLPELCSSAAQNVNNDGWAVSAGRILPNVHESFDNDSQSLHPTPKAAVINSIACFFPQFSKVVKLFINYCKLIIFYYGVWHVCNNPWTTFNWTYGVYCCWKKLFMRRVACSVGLQTLCA